MFGVKHIDSSLKDKLFLVFSLFVFFTLFSPKFFFTGMTGAFLLLAAGLFYFSSCKLFFLENKKPIILLIASLLVGVVFSELPQKSIKGSYDFLRGLSLIFPAFVCSQMYPRYKEFFEKLGTTIVLLGAGALIYFSLPYLKGNSSSFLQYSYHHAGILFGNVHNLINGVALLMLFGTVLLLFGTHRVVNKITILSCVILFFVLLILFRSEGTYLGLLFSAFAYVFFLKKKMRVPVLLLSSGMLCGLISLFALPNFYKDNVHFSFGGGAARSDIYSAIVPAIGNSPWVGYGINTYKYLDIGQTKSIGHTLLFPHQIFLEVLFSLGFIGATFFLLSLISYLKKVGNPLYGRNILCVLGLLAGTYLLIKGMTDGKIFGFYYSGIFGMSLGFLYGGRL